ncbi:MAG TPA: hypothetical protein VHO94_04005 [Oscillospiraceae bacterium]|nr:hypothetical protein [Oscillospiraceae bacterium]
MPTETDIVQLQFRQGLKADLIAADLIPGEPVYAIDTSEIGVALKDGTVLWVATAGTGANKAVLASEKGVASGVPSLNQNNEVDQQTALTIQSATVQYGASAQMQLTFYKQGEHVEVHNTAWMDFGPIPSNGVQVGTIPNGYWPRGVIRAAGSLIDQGWHGSLFFGGDGKILAFPVDFTNHMRGDLSGASYYTD